MSNYNNYSLKNLESKISDLRIVKINYNEAENGNLTVIEANKDVPFSIARVFMVHGSEGSVRGNHAHRLCSQFLTCPYGEVEVNCDDSNERVTFTLDKPNIGLLVPSGIWSNQKYIKPDSILTVLCDRNYESNDYIRSYEQYIKYVKTNK